MAGIGEASSVIAIAGLAGDTIKASFKLYTFCKSYESLDSNFEEIAKELQGLQDDVQQIERLSPTAPIDPTFNQQFSHLGLALADCRKFVEEWTKRIAALDLGSGKGRKAFVKKLKIVADQEYFPRIREGIMNHRKRINTSLNTLELYVCSY